MKLFSALGKAVSSVSSVISNAVLHTDILTEHKDRFELSFDDFNVLMSKIFNHAFSGSDEGIDFLANTKLCFPNNIAVDDSMKKELMEFSVGGPNFYPIRNSDGSNVILFDLVYSKSTEFKTSLEAALTQLSNMSPEVRQAFPKIIIPIIDTENENRPVSLVMEYQEDGNYQARIMDAGNYPVSGVSEKLEEYLEFSEAALHLPFSINTIDAETGKRNTRVHLNYSNIAESYSALHYALYLNNTLIQNSDKSWMKGTKQWLTKKGSPMQRYYSADPMIKRNIRESIKNFSYGSTELTVEDSKVLSQYGYMLLNHILKEMPDNIDHEKNSGEFLEILYNKIAHDDGFKALRDKSSNIIKRIVKGRNASPDYYISGNDELVMATAISHALSKICESRGEGFSRGSMKIAGQKLFDFLNFVIGPVINNGNPIKGKLGKYAALTALKPLEYTEVDPRVYMRDPKAGLGLSSHYKQHSKQFGMDTRFDKGLEPIEVLPNKASHILFGLLSNEEESDRASTFIKFEPYGMGTAWGFINHALEFLHSGHVKTGSRREKDVPLALKEIYAEVLSVSVKSIGNIQVGEMIDNLVKKIQEEKEWVDVDNDEVIEIDSEHAALLAEKLHQFMNTYSEIFSKDDPALAGFRTGNEVILSEQDIIDSSIRLLTDISDEVHVDISTKIEDALSIRKKLLAVSDLIFPSHDPHMKNLLSSSVNRIELLPALEKDHKRYGVDYPLIVDALLKALALNDDAQLPKTSALLDISFKPVLGEEEDSRQQSCIDLMDAVCKSDKALTLMQRSLQDISGIAQILHKLSDYKLQGADPEAIRMMDGGLQDAFNLAHANLVELQAAFKDDDQVAQHVACILEEFDMLCTAYEWETDIAPKSKLSMS